MMLAELGRASSRSRTPTAATTRASSSPSLQGQSAYFASLNRGKESIALDLKNAARPRRVAGSWSGRADVLVENFRPGTLERLGLGYDNCSSDENPRLIYAAVSGFGHTGPWSRKPAYDLIVQALGGMMSVTGMPGGPPTKAGTSIGDITGGLFLLSGIAAALYHREQTGRRSASGCGHARRPARHPRTCASCVTLPPGQVPVPMGNRHPSITPFEPYAAADRPFDHRGRQRCAVRSTCARRWAVLDLATDRFRRPTANARGMPRS